MDKIQNINTAEKLGLAIKRIRKEKGLSQAELAAQLRIKQATVSSVESGKGKITSFMKILQALQVSLTVDLQLTKKSRAEEILGMVERK